MKKPKSELPWKESIYYYIEDNKGNPLFDIVVDDNCLLHIEDRDYIVQACNNFQGAVDWIKYLKEFIPLEFENEIYEVDEFLKKIDEK